MSATKGRTGRFLMACAAGASLLAGAAAAQTPSFRDRPPEDEVIYFVLPDRFENGDPSNDEGGFGGDRLTHGFDPTHKGFFHGGDLRGLTERLDYIQGLGATAIWLGPIYTNQPVQGPPGAESAGYHGYWITDFTRVDPHFGTNDELAALVDAAHARGMKVYLDIITNHTADVIRYRECPDNDCAFRSRADYPWTRRGGLDGDAINEGFLGGEVGDDGNFARLTRPDWAYTPYVPEAEEGVKVPAWLNGPIHYHNRGNFGQPGEVGLYGDFAGLDDLFTEDPRVVQGLIDIYGDWIDRYGIDGFRVDTARHVNPEFWQAFIPAMLERARARGIPNFHIFAETYEFEVGPLARFTHLDRFPYVLDFAFQGVAADVIARNGSTHDLRLLFEQDPAYAGGVATARGNPTFVGNHDMGRFAMFVRDANPEASEDELLKRIELGHALMMFARGAPTIYYGDEQGFVGLGGDQDARQDMFPSQVARYNGDPLIGATATTADSNFDTGHPLYRAISEMAAVRAAEPALRRGDMVVRESVEGPGLFAFSRRLDGREVVVAINTGAEPLEVSVWTDAASDNWRALQGACPAASSAPGSLALSLEPFAYAVCVSETES